MFLKTCRRSLILCFEVLAYAIVAVGIVCGGLYWRLSQGPINLNFMKPYVQEGMNQVYADMTLTLGDVGLVWGDITDPLSLNTTDVTILDTQRNELARIDALRFNLSIPALLIGRVAMTAIDIRQPDLTVVRRSNGQFYLSLNPIESSPGDPMSLPERVTKDGDGVLSKALKNLSTRPSLMDPSRSLKRIQLSDANLRYLDPETGIDLQIPSLSGQMQRGDDQITGEVVIPGIVGIDDMRADLDVIHRIDDNQTLIDISMAGVNPSDMVNISTRFSGLRDIDMPVSADITLQLADNFVLSDLRGNIQADDGTIKFPPILPTVIPIRDLSTAIEFDPRDKNLIIGPATVQSNGIEGTANILLAFVEGGLDVAIDATAFDMPIDQLKPYWPAVIGQKARDWVDERLSDGVATRADTKITGTLRDGNFNLNDITGQISYNELTVEYIDGMTPVREVSGTANYSTHHFELDIDTGKIRNSQLKKAAIRIEGKFPTIIDIDLSTDGPFSDIMAIINEQPFRLADKAGIPPTSVDGRSLTNLTIRFPVIPDLSIQDINLSANATIQDTILRQVAFGQSLRSDRLAMSVTKKELSINGDIELGPLSGKLDFSQYFDPSQRPDNIARKLTLSGRAGQTDFTALFDTPEMPMILDGLAGYTVNFTEKSNGNGRGDIALELDNVGINLPWLNYTKSTGQAAGFSAQVEKQDGWAIENGDYQSNSDSVRLNARFDTQNRIRQAEASIDRLGPNSSISLSVARTGNGDRKITVRGDQMDGRYYFSDIGQVEPDDAPSRPISKTTDDDIGLSISLQVDKFITGPDQSLINLAYFNRRDGGGNVMQMELDAVTGTNGSGENNNLYIRYLPLERPDRLAHSFRMEADNAGQTMRRLRWTNKLYAGKLVVDARTPANPTHPMELTGRAIMDDYRIQQVPVMARLLNALSPGGLIELLNNEGLNFSRLVTDFNWTPQQIRLTDGRTAGQSIGLTFEGAVGLGQKNQLNLNGTVVPIYGVNAMISQIPLLGSILAGQKGEGVFAVTYSITGPLEQAVVTVNPLSALAPGFLRRLFFQGGGETAQPVEDDVPLTDGSDDKAIIPVIPDENEAAETILDK